MGQINSFEQAEVELDQAQHQLGLTNVFSLIGLLYFFILELHALTDVSKIVLQNNANFRRFDIYAVNIFRGGVTP